METAAGATAFATTGEAYPKPTGAAARTCVKRNKEFLNIKAVHDLRDFEISKLTGAGAAKSPAWATAARARTTTYKKARSSIFDSEIPIYKFLL